METDYLIVGAGALGLGFADQLLSDTDATITIVDKHDSPGGHWNDAYPFVRLHQPSAFYGVGSRDLGSNLIDSAGINKGFYELASGAEVRAYFCNLMQERFLPSGRVSYFPSCEYLGNSQIKNLDTGESQSVSIRRKIVDATFFNTAVPSVCKPKFNVEPDVPFIPPNDLPDRKSLHSHFTVLGGGKTSMDVCVWLLENGTNPEQIRWIVPRDSWLINRETTQPGDSFYSAFLEAKAIQLECCAKAKDVTQLFELLEQHRQLLRIDENVSPSMYHSATIAPAEVELLRSIDDVIRMGRVKSISSSKIVMEQGFLESPADSLYINCTSSAFELREPVPIFEKGKITIQMIRAGLFCLSTAVIAYVEANYGADDVKNKLCVPLRSPDSPLDWLTLTQAENDVMKRWADQENLRRWISTLRLTGANLRTKEYEQLPEILAIKNRIKAVGADAEKNLNRLISNLSQNSNHRN